MIDIFCLLVFGFVIKSVNNNISDVNNNADAFVIYVHMLLIINNADLTINKKKNSRKTIRLLL